MAAIFIKPFGNRSKMAGFRMVGTLAIAIAKTGHSKTEPLEIRTSKTFHCVQYSNIWYSSPQCIDYLPDCFLEVYR